MGRVGWSREEMRDLERGFYTYRSYTAALGLSLSEAAVYSTLRSFSKKYPKGFSGSRGYLSDMTGLSVRSIARILTTLVGRGLIRKGYTEVNNKPHPAYLVDVVRSDELVRAYLDEQKHRKKKRASLYEAMSDEKDIPFGDDWREEPTREADEAEGESILKEKSISAEHSHSCSGARGVFYGQGVSGADKAENNAEGQRAQHNDAEPNISEDKRCAQHNDAEPNISEDKRRAQRNDAESNISEDKKWARHKDAEPKSAENRRWVWRDDPDPKGREKGGAAPGYESRSGQSDSGFALHSRANKKPPPSRSATPIKYLSRSGCGYSAEEIMQIAIARSYAEDD